MKRKINKSDIPRSVHIIKWIISCKTQAQLDNCMKYYTKYFLTPLKDSPSNDYFQTWLDGVITGLVIGKSCGYSPLIVEEFQKSLQTIIK